MSLFTRHRGRITAFMAAMAMAAMAVLPTSYTAAQLLGPACEGAAAGSPVCEEEDGNPAVGEDGLLTTAARIISLATGIISVIIIIISGLSITMSSGNSQSIQSARDAIIYAGVALAISALAQVIIIFIVSRL